MHGMRLKFWISDRETNRWGAVMLWDATADLTAPMPPNRAAELIGYPPTVRILTDVEAIVEGIHAGQSDDLGLAIRPRPEPVGEHADAANLSPPSVRTHPTADGTAPYLAGRARATPYQPGALALATADTTAPSNRIVQVLAVRDTGLVFASHADSRKGRELAETAGRRASSTGAR